MSSVSSTSSSSSSTSINVSTSSSTLRITGLSTGLDVDSIVEKMLYYDQAKINRAKQDLQILQWKQETYKDIISEIKTFQNKYLNSSLSSSNMLSSKNYSAFDAVSTVSGVASATATTGAVEGTYSVNVLQTAKAASISGNSLFTQAKISSSTDWNGKTIQFDINSDGSSDTSITIDSDFSGSMDDLISLINSKITADSNLKGKISASLLLDSSGTYIRLNSISGSTKITDDGGTGFGSRSIITPSINTKLTDLNSNTNKIMYLNLNYNGTDISITIDNSDGTKKIKDVIDAISTATSNKVTAKYDQLSGQFVIQNANTGSTSALKVIKSMSGYSDTDTDLLSSLNLSTNLSGNVYGSASQGQDAKVTITSPGGTATTITQSNNSFTINNVTYNLTGTGSTDITITQNVDTVFNKIKDFIDGYNSIVDKIYTILNEKRDYDYSPLTDAQKKEMSEDDIEKWEEKAKQGILRNDTNLQNLLVSMRRAFYDAVEGAGISFNSKTLGLDSTKEGKIEFIDGGEEILKNALKENGEKIANLFCKYSSDADSNTKYKNQGIFQRINDIIVKNVGVAGVTSNSAILTKMANKQNDYSIYGSTGSNTFPDQIYRQSILIQKLNQKYSDDKEKYYDQFSSLETAMEELNSQMSWLYQQLGIS
ncbi:flagellar capping protein [Caloramator sp. E03]|uniref:flagellar filament capping protein FliD n=1 Tax=Caloramator sp. E03 TaxID=2576307 RepID=UPI0011107B1D|nr:flagellar filament capping protein FliD [Caloramator sp. E03]QCX32371.1 flagellar capping protein [Caloramator sp. E03]